METYTDFGVSYLIQTFVNKIFTKIHHSIPPPPPRPRHYFRPRHATECISLLFSSFDALLAILPTLKMAEEHTTLNEEKLTQLIRKIFQEQLKKQEVHITNIISSNFKITMEEIKKS